MPKCVKCNEFLPPNYTEVIEGSQPDPLDEGRYPQHCIFCKLGIEKVERETSQGSGQYVEYTKAQCIEDYKDFTKKIKNRSDLKKLMESNRLL